jgi:thiosulfate dehydrogenase
MHRAALLLVSLSVSHLLGAQRVGPASPNARRGHALLTAFNDSLPRNGGNALRCTSCHLDDGRRATAMSWLNVTTRYPKYRARRGDIESIEQRVNECIRRSLAGQPLAESSAEMRDIVAYLDSLRSTAPVARPDTVRLSGDTIAGARGYAAHCARCHGARGGGGAAPAVWGAASYSIGAGMARQQMLATFLRWNMPHDRAGTLSDQQSADIAAYILRRPRQDFPGKDADWPRGDAPVDVAYATSGARRAGKPLPQARPLLPRRSARPRPLTTSR